VGKSPRIVRELEAGKKVDAVVMRKGKKETIKDITLPEEKKVERPVSRLPFEFGAVRPGAGEKVIVQRVTGDQFTTTQRDGRRTITVRGKLVGGKAQPAEIRVTQGRGPAEVYKSIDQVPEALRKQVKTLVELSAKDVVTSKEKK
jgi:hypothetical protein